MVHHSQEDGILRWLIEKPSSMLLFHHRFPTSTINVKRAAHPFSTKDYFGDTEYILVHNGSIRNADELFCDHQELGIEYKSLLEDMTFNDSEALLWDFALTMEHKQDELKAYGNIAFVCLKLVNGKLERMFFGRNDNPLNMYREVEGIMLSSEGPGEAIRSQHLYNYNYAKNRLTKRTFTVPQYKPWKCGGASNETGFRGGLYEPGRYGGACLSIHDCNCKNVGWENCAYHGYLCDPEFDTGVSATTDALTADDDWDTAMAEDDDEAYLRWWERQIENDEATRAGNWVTGKLRDKFGRLVDAAADSRRKKGHHYDSQQKLWLPNTSLSTAIKRETTRRTQEYELIGRLGDMPEPDEVLKTFLEYLTRAQGHFEQAYWFLEADYDDVQALPKTRENIRQQILLEKTMERLENDSDYIDEKSVSTVWEDLWTTTS